LDEIKDFVNDSEDKVQKCLNCTQDYCTNCLDYRKDPNVVKKKRERGGINYKARLTIFDRKVVEAYITCNSDHEISDLLEVDRRRVVATRNRLRLPSAATFSENERRLMVAPWMEEK